MVTNSSVVLNCHSYSQFFLNNKTIGSWLFIGTSRKKFKTLIITNYSYLPASVMQILSIEMEFTHP